MDPKNKYPGIYINERSTFPKSVVPLPTAVPAFIGYTPGTDYNGQSFLKKPTKITSFREFKKFFGTTSSTLDFPQYYLTLQKNKAVKGNYVSLNGIPHLLSPDPDTIYYLYNSIRLFFINGGNEAYIVSVGTYGKPSGKPTLSENSIINQNVKLEELLDGIVALKNEREPTMYICPDATLLSDQDYAQLMDALLSQCAYLDTAISIFDVKTTAGNVEADIDTFRQTVGDTNLKYGCAYYPFLKTTVVQSDDITFKNLFNGDLEQLSEYLKDEKTDPSTLLQILNKYIEDKAPNISQYHQVLTAVVPVYKDIISEVVAAENTLPPSGAIAGIITVTDNNRGVWQAPANASLIGVKALTTYIDNQQQAYLNVDPARGKSVNALRSFPGTGILVWGTRTLDGINQENQYIQTVRTQIFIRQSVSTALRALAAEPNDASTWSTVRAMIENFLYEIWRAGGLAGSKPEKAYAIDCDLHLTMTVNDIQQGRLVVSIKIALMRPAEFIIIEVEQQMAG